MRKLEFFFPDSFDQVSPYFDFITEQHPKHRIRQRDDVYAHELLVDPPYDGILLSKAMVDGSEKGGTRTSGKYSAAMSQRLYREGVSKFFRLRRKGRQLMSMGDCGAFTYFAKTEPVYTVKEVVDFYEALGFDRGVSLDHIIFDRQPQGTTADEIAEDKRLLMKDHKRRFNLNHANAEEFMYEVEKRENPFTPVGAAHGWDPDSRKESFGILQDLGFQHISLGGMVRRPIKDVLEALEAISSIKKPATKLHLLGITKIHHSKDYIAQGVTSIDSTTPLRQSFMDEEDNYWIQGDRYTAIRIPQVDASPALKRRIKSGLVDQDEAFKLEQRSLSLIRAYEKEEVEIDTVMATIEEYELLWGGKASRMERYRRTLEDQPWRACRCGICDQIGIEVIIFRGAERNRRRGFHNLSVFRKELNHALATD